MISAHVKADVKQQEIQELVVYLVFFYKKYFQKLKYNVPSGMYFSFNFAWDSIQPGLVIKNRGSGGVYLTDKIR